MPRKARLALAFDQEPEAPIRVKIRLKNHPELIEFRCSERTVENGFHVFVYPDERNRYYTTRREFAISEIVEIEITAAMEQVRIGAGRHEAAPAPFYADSTLAAPTMIRSSGPVIHSARKAAISTLEKLETSNGPIKMDTMPVISFGDSTG